MNPKQSQSEMSATLGGIRLFIIGCIDAIFFIKSSCIILVVVRTSSPFASGAVVVDIDVPHAFLLKDDEEHAGIKHSGS